MDTRTHLDSRVDGLRGTARPRESVRLFIFARHAESSANAARVISSDPSRSTGLTSRGRAQARRLGAQLANLDIDIAVCSRFPRSRQTLEITLRGRAVPVLTDPGFDEIRAGDFDGQPVDAYWAWKERHRESERFPHGESLDEALLRYANALRRLLLRTETFTLLVVHEFALRHISEAANTRTSLSSDPPVANALPYLFDQRAIGRAASGLEAAAKSDRA